MLPALEFQPIVKRARWGGRRLGTILGKPIGPHSDAAESWEIVDRESDQSVVIGGPWQGWTLHRLVEALAGDLLGRHAGEPRFPLLVKYLDTRDRLSVQVHPNDEQAANLHARERGKTEAWVILHADPGSRLHVGLNRGVDRPALESAVVAGTIEQCLHSFPVQAGDCVHVPAGTVHAIGEGIVLAEIQQTSDLTFRLFDWNRVGSDGSQRPLHIASALDCTDYTRGPVDPVTPVVVERFERRRIEELVCNPHFALRRHSAAEPLTLPPADHCRVLMLLAGEAELLCGPQRRALAFGATLLLPAAAPETRISPAAASAEIILLEAFPS